MAALFRRLSLGVYVVGVARGKYINAFTAAWITQVSFKPLMLALSVNPNNASYRLIKAGRVFSVNVLAQDQMHLARHFGTDTGQTRDKLAGCAWHTALTGAPILDDTLAYFDCRVRFTHRAGSHVLVVGQVIYGALLKPHAVPMSYAQTGDLDSSSALYPTSF
jgi:flavin reductase (DIM6/NTAB) family NADH-FMN oxidoreductase RutF